MANRNWASGGKIYSMHVSPVILDTTILIGAVGAVTSIVGSAIASVTRSSTGIYVIHMQDNYSGLYSAIGSMRSPPAGLSGILAVECQNAPNSAVQSLAAPSLTIKTLDAAGALADPASGSSVSVIMYLSNSSVQIGGE